MVKLTRFQEECKSEVASLFGRYGVHVAFNEGSCDSYAAGHSDKEVYLVSTARVGRSTFRCYIYEDEAGYYEGDVVWKIFESPDFEGATSLIRAFIADLDSAMAEASVSLDPGRAIRPSR